MSYLNIYNLISARLALLFTILSYALAAQSMEQDRPQDKPRDENEGPEINFIIVINDSNNNNNNNNNNNSNINNKKTMLDKQITSNTDSASQTAELTTQHNHEEPAARVVSFQCQTGLTRCMQRFCSRDTAIIAKNFIVCGGAMSLIFWAVTGH